MFLNVIDNNKEAKAALLKTLEDGQPKPTPPVQSQ